MRISSRVVRSAGWAAMAVAVAAGSAWTAGRAAPGAAAADAAGARRPLDVLAAIHARRSVRAYQKEPLTAAELEVLVRAGSAAPTAGNQQPWEFVVVTERAVLDALAAALPYGRMLKAAPAAIVVGGDTARLRPGATGEMWVQDCAAATQNILLAAEGLGLGGVWLGVHPDAERAAQVGGVVGLPETVKAFAVVSLGRPAGDEKPKDKYRADRVHADRFGRPFAGGGQ